VPFCTEAWVIRNMIFDRLGHCFGSVTGQMLFDNSTARSRVPRRPLRWPRISRLIREGENFVGCRIDTSRPPTPEMYRVHAHFSRFIDLPVPDHVGGYACWGYRGPDFRVLSGANVNAPEIGIARTGQSVVTDLFRQAWRLGLRHDRDRAGRPGPDRGLVRRRRSERRELRSGRGLAPGD
jgi:hypothetical protein